MLPRGGSSFPSFSVKWNSFVLFHIERFLRFFFPLLKRKKKKNPVFKCSFKFLKDFDFYFYIPIKISVGYFEILIFKSFLTRLEAYIIRFQGAWLRSNVNPVANKYTIKNTCLAYDRGMFSYYKSLRRMHKPLKSVNKFHFTGKYFPGIYFLTCNSGRIRIRKQKQKPLRLTKYFSKSFFELKNFFKIKFVFKIFFDKNFLKKVSQPKIWWFFTPLFRRCNFFNWLLFLLESHYR